MPLITRQFGPNAKGSKLTIEEMDDNLLWVNNLTEVAYTELTNLIGANNLVPGQYYLITDFRTCYDQPDYDKYKSPIAVSGSSWVPTSIDPIVVLAVSENSLALDAFQPSYPNDTIKYDVTYSTTESGNTAFGRITERVDEWGNRADYDHRTIEFKRYRLRTYDRLSPQPGTVELQSGGTVLGTLTNFTALFPGQVIAIRNSSETFYTILSITDNFTMTVTGETITATGAGFQFFDTNSHSYDSYYPNNVDGQLDFSLYKTFEAADVDGCINTYIGDHAKYFLEFGNGDFLLANNVLKDGSYSNNTIGDSSYNNTFNDDCTANQIGYGFRNNITDDDFDENVIGTFFENNIITANFYDNHVGNDFNDNFILCDSFYRNQIGNDFRDNWIDSDWGFDFQNNQIGNQFNNNEIYKAFHKNVILNGYNNNQTWDEVVGNQIGNGMNGNQIYSVFDDNQIKDYFSNNTLSDSSNIGSYQFGENIIGNDFTSNNIIGRFFSNNIMNNFSGNSIENDFGYNQIGSDFSSNNIDYGFGFGGSQARGNKIGNQFQSNTIAEYFYDNITADVFTGNTIGDYCVNNKFDGNFASNIIGVNFQNNDIKVYGLTSTDFKAAQGNINAITHNTPSGIDNVYTNVNPNTTNSTYGTGASFDITVSGSVVSGVAINQPGTQYLVGDQLDINGSQFGGIDGVDDLNIAVTGLLTFPYVYKQLNCTIFIDEADFTKLAFIDGTGTLQVTEITPP